MMTGPDGDIQDSTWRQIEEIVDQVTELSRADLPQHGFYDALLRHASRAGAALGGAVWRAEREHLFWLEIQDHPDNDFFVRDGRINAAHLELLTEVQSTGCHQAVTAAQGSNGAPASSRQVLIACPITLAGNVIRILEIVPRADISPDTQEGFTEVLSALCELAGDYERGVRLRQLQSQEADREQVDRFCQEIHSSLDLDRTAYTLANEAKRIVHCDRVTVAVARGHHCRIRAISGLDTFDRRANSNRLLERLIDCVCAVNEPLWYSSNSQQLAPQVDAAIQQYVDVAHVRTVTVIPLRYAQREDVGDDGSPPMGALVFESFKERQGRQSKIRRGGPNASCRSGGTSPLPLVASLVKKSTILDTGAEDDYRRRVRTVCTHAANSLHNAIRYDRLPGVRVIEKLAFFRTSRTWVRMLLWGAPLLIAVALLIFVPADFFVRCEGRLQPQMQRRIFAPRDGQVEKLLVDDSQILSAGAVVATMRSSELDFEYTRLLGDLQTTAKQFDAVHASRLGANPTGSEARDEYARLTAEEERLGKLLSSLEEQRELLDAQREALNVRSPIAGQVVTWELKDLLEGRPVKRGQVLVTVADVKGPWVLEVQIPDKHINYVLQARRDLQPELDVRFMLATEPGTTLHGKLDHVAASSEPDELQQLFVTATVTFDSDDLSSPLPGAGVTTRVYCGRRSIGYVWLHDLIEAVRAKLFI